MSAVSHNRRRGAINISRGKEEEELGVLEGLIENRREK